MLPPLRVQVQGLQAVEELPWGQAQRVGQPQDREQRHVAHSPTCTRQTIRRTRRTRSGCSAWGCARSPRPVTTSPAVSPRHAVASAADTVVNSSAYTWFNEHLNPAYFTLMAYYDEGQAAENGCGLLTEAKYGAEGTLSLVGTGAAAAGIEEAGSAVLGWLGVGTTEAMTGAAVEQAITALPPGTGTNVFTVSNTSDLDQLFAELSKGGTPVDSTYPGEMVELPDGTRVGLRPGSTSGGPTIDAKIPGNPALKVHVTPWPPVG